MKQLFFKPKILLLFLFAIAANYACAQIRFMPDYLAIGKVSAPQSGFIHIKYLNSLIWKHENHFFKIDMSNAVPAISGTNGRVDIADLSYDAVMYMPFTCSSVYSVIYNSFLTGTQSTSLQLLKTLTPYQTKNRVADASQPDFGFTVDDKSESITESNPLVETDDNGEKILSYSKLIPVLLQSVMQLQTIASEQETQIKELEESLNSKKLNLNL